MSTKFTKVAVAALFLVNVAIWSYAGYAIGEVRGRGWRAAVVEAGCQLRCPVDAKL
jgi:hypothetical protein